MERNSEVRVMVLNVKTLLLLEKKVEEIDMADIIFLNEVEIIFVFCILRHRLKPFTFATLATLIFFH